MSDGTLVVLVAFGLCFSVACGFLWLVVRLATALRPVSAASRNQRYVAGQVVTAPAAPSGWSAGFDRWFYRLVRDCGLTSPIIAMGLVMGAGVLAAAVLFVIFENELASLAGMVLGALAALGIGFGVATRRRRQVAEQLPGWMELLARSLRAGRSLEQALRTSQEKLRGPFAADLRRCADQLDLGLRIEDAFRDMGRHYEMLEMQMVIGALSMHRQTGGDLATALERLAAVSRQRLEYRRQAQAASSSARFAALCLCLAPPVIFLYYYFTNQFIGNLLSDATGQFALALALGLELVGIVWLLYLSRSEV